MNPPSSIAALSAADPRVDEQDPLFMTHAAERRALDGRASAVRAIPRATGHVVAALAALVLAWHGDAPLASAAMVLLALTGGSVLAGREPEWRSLLPFMGALS